MPTCDLARSDRVAAKKSSAQGRQLAVGLGVAAAAGLARRAVAAGKEEKQMMSTALPWMPVPAHLRPETWRFRSILAMSACYFSVAFLPLAAYPIKRVTSVSMQRR